MITRSATFLIALLLCAAVPALAVANENAEAHRRKAQSLAEQKDWAQAASEAREAVELDPKNADAWLLLGLCEQRLERNAKAAEAYRQYLALSPPESKAAAVHARLAEVEVRHETKTREEDRENSKSYGPSSWAFGFGFAPVFTNAISSQLGSGISRTFEFFFRVAEVRIGFQFGSGDLTGNIQAAPRGSEPASGGPAPTYSSIPTQSMSVKALSAGYDFNLVSPYGDLGPVQLFIPGRFAAQFGSVTAGGRDFGSTAVDFAAGIGAAFYTKSPIGFEITALYHLSLAFNGPREDDESPAIRTSAGEEVTGSFRGFELGAAVRIMLGDAG